MRGGGGGTEGRVEGRETRNKEQEAGSREKAEDGKSFKNPETGVLSKAYEAFPDPLNKGPRGGL